MSSLPEVEVLLATFNGARFLREQIDSIFAQDYGNVRVLARDDGSSDGTVAILGQYAERFPGRFRVMPAGVASGSPKSNFLLLMKASTADYICFSDQDDVWLPDKVSRTKQAMDQLESRWGTRVPLLVFTDLHVVDDKLKTLHKSFWTCMRIDPGDIARSAQLMVRSVVTGCTGMLNRQLLELSLRMPEEAYMHDRWISWLASFMGKASIVNAQTVLYRQHDRNVVGVDRQFLAAVKPRRRPLLQRILRLGISPGQVIQWETNQGQARSFLKEYGAELPARKRNMLKAFLRCQTSRSRFIRVGSLIRHGFYHTGLKPNFSMVIHLWKMKVDEDARRRDNPALHQACAAYTGNHDEL
jgi:glycosyltransferase involved in cell wall biosynthesis